LERIKWEFVFFLILIWASAATRDCLGINKVHVLKHKFNNAKNNKHKHAHLSRPNGPLVISIPIARLVAPVETHQGVGDKHGIMLIGMVEKLELARDRRKKHGGQASSSIFEIVH
jgi:hypothetical protein